MLRVSPDLPFPHKNRASSARGPSDDGLGMRQAVPFKGIAMPASPSICANVHFVGFPPLDAAETSGEVCCPIPVISTSRPWCFRTVGRDRQVRSVMTHLRKSAERQPDHHLAAVAQSRGDAIDRQVNATDDILVPVARAITLQQLDLHMIKWIEIGKAVTD